MKDIYDVLVIGGGPAGLAAAIEAKKNGALDVLVIERNGEAGGILHQCIHNGFGAVLFNKDMPGPSYAEYFVREAEKFGINILTDTAVIDMTASRHVYANNIISGFIELEGRAIVLAMGCRERTRAQIRIPGTRPAGVFTAGMVQRMVNIEGYMPGNRFVILGSGDIGMIMARRLVLEGAKVERILEAMPFLTGLRRNYVQCIKDFGIRLDLGRSVSGIIGDKRVEAVRTVQVDESFFPVPGTEETIECDTLLVSIGLIPENELSRKAGIDLDPLTGGPFVDDKMETNVDGIFAAGNAVTIYDIADYVSLAGYTAGKNAAIYAERLKSGNTAPRHPNMFKINCGYNVRSIVPQYVSPETLSGNGFTLGLRASRPIEKKVLMEVMTGSRVMKSYRENYARPAEMIIRKIKPDEWACPGMEETGELEIRLIEMDGD
jgi:NADPH-dependent 2,4-dienoyl-CoA reductase/sulfur reductase-like enzyme